MLVPENEIVEVKMTNTIQANRGDGRDDGNCKLQTGIVVLEE